MLLASILLAFAAMAAADSDADPQQPTQSPAAGVQLRSFSPLGCFSNPGSMWDMGPYTFQTNGWCQPLCVRQGASYFGLVNGTNCFCGTSAPPSSKKVPDGDCDVTCNGFASQNCGGNNRWAVYSDGYRNGDDTGTIHITTPTQTWFGHAATGKGGSTLKTITGPNTIYVTQSSDAAASTSAIPDSPGPNKAAIAAGVVVGVVVLAGGIGGVLFYFRLKKKRELEDERRRHESIMRIVNRGEKPSSLSGSDSRLEPSVMFQRRQSDGSIMDNQDYSRRILKVTNPDDR